MHGGDGLDGVVEAVAFLARQSRRIFQFFMRAKAGEGVLDGGTDPAVFGVVLLLTAQEGASGSSAVRDDQAGSQVGAVRDHRRPGRRGRQVRLPPDVGIGLVSGRRPSGGDDQAGVSVDDDLHVYREAVVAGGGADLAVAN